MLGQPQREAMLRAMGYRPLRLRRDDAADTGSVATPHALAAAPQPVAQPSPARPSQPTDRDPLWQALLRAVHASLEQVDALGWEAVLDGPPYRYDGPRLYLNLIALRGQPAAKRALWKTLRALRRRRQGTQG
ncbi:hypothetical protein [Pseudomarimonas arenosa]|uniref:Uncharacterized protein n=1 Tax=Pseudomarimonas arenosa TaxID=2774145 RepID=A0AAW3ZHP5_9GAMM|nr:hypothetical protein [Pseudomarimonas arenosa]MBD8525615.1 hypothetical protein [Pseudomarimonas arenosa]